jgi:hypothetical protein
MTSSKPTKIPTKQSMLSYDTSEQSIFLKRKVKNAAN